MKGKITKNEPLFPDQVKSAAGDIKEIFVDGDPSLMHSRCIAVVGSRTCTQYGRTVARLIGKKAAENGVTVVSGLAKGVDTAGHMGALEAGGKTIAVLGGGTEYYYPAENRRLQQQIAEEGLLISLHPPAYVPRPYDFPRRNGLISALAESVVIVEAGKQSGALITAVCAAEQGRRLYAVPGNITSHYSFGTNELIREGVSPLIFLDDLLIDMGIVPKAEENDDDKLGETEKRVVEMIRKHGEMTIDEIYHKMDMKLSEINGIITVLEMKGIIFSSLGKVFVAKF